MHPLVVFLWFVMVVLVLLLLLLVVVLVLLSSHQLQAKRMTGSLIKKEILFGCCFMMELYSGHHRERPARIAVALAGAEG